MTVDREQALTDLFLARLSGLSTASIDRLVAEVLALPDPEVEQLRAAVKFPPHPPSQATLDLAAKREIESLRAEIARLRKVEAAARELADVDSILHASALAETWLRYTDAIAALRSVLSSQDEPGEREPSRCDDCEDTGKVWEPCRHELGCPECPHMIPCGNCQDEPGERVEITDAMVTGDLVQCRMRAALEAALSPEVTERREG